MKSLDNSMKIKSDTYYKIYYHEDNGYYILYTGNKWVYIIAKKYYNKPLEKHDKKRKWFTINDYQDYIDTRNIKIEEVSKEDLFLEML